MANILTSNADMYITAYFDFIIYILNGQTWPLFYKLWYSCK